MLTLRIALSLAAILLILTAVSAFGENPDKPEVEEKYVDLDGDGIRDNARDTDNDGIPDFNRNDEKEQPAELAGLVSFGSAGESFRTELIQTNLEQFRMRKFSCRGQNCCRGEFGAGDFGPSLGVTGSVSGACAGGLCF